MSMRAQLNIMTDDEELFDGLIKPYKEEKLLNNLILKCLSAYYYNEEVRNLIEGTSLDDSEETTSTQSLVDGIRADVATQKFLADELQKTIEAGTEDVSEILNRTDKATEKSGIAKTTQTEYGASALKIEQHNWSIGTNQSEPEHKQSEIKSDDTLKILVMAVSKLAEANGNKEVVDLLNNQDITKVDDSSLESDKNDSGVADSSFRNDITKLASELATTGNDLTLVKDILNTCLSAVNDAESIKSVQKEDDSKPAEQGQLPVDIEVENPNESKSGVVKSYATIQEKAKAEAEQTARENKAFLGRGHYNMSADAVIVPSDSIERIQVANNNLNQALQQHNEAVASLQEVAL